METMMDQFEGRKLRAIVVLAGLIVGLMGAVPEASAADDEALALTLVNGAGTTGAPIADKLRRILRAEDRVKYVSEGDVLEAGRSHGVTVETLRRGSERARHKAEFRKTMREVGIHAVLVLDVFSGTAQVVTVGPEGGEVSDRRRELSGGSLPTKRAGALLKEAFGDLIPKWKEWKQRQKKRAEQGPTESQGLAAGADTGGSSTRATPAGSEAGGSTGGQTSRPGALDGGIRLWVGGIAGRHSLTALEVGVDGYNLGQANPFLGGRAELTAMLGRFNNNTIGIGLQLFGSYAPFEIVFQRENQPSEKLASDLTQAGFDLLYLRQLSNRLRFQFGSGFEVLSLRVSSNPNYTGNRYAQFRFTGNFKYRVLSSLHLEAGGGLAPILESDMSGGAMGDSQFAPAVLGSGAIELTAFDPVVISVKYDIYYYDLVFRSPSLTENPIDVTDTYQFGGLQFSYGF